MKLFGGGMRYDFKQAGVNCEKGMDRDERRVGGG